MTYIKKTKIHLAVVIFGLVALFLPSISQAQTDTRCFTKDECITERKLIMSPKTLGVGVEPPSDQEAAEGFYLGTDAVSTCGVITQPGKSPEQMGFCLPAGKTVTQISFGGKTKFAHIGEFIQFIYKYGIMVASIVSVVVVIVAGLQWTMSGGNTATIESAKKRIGGAIIGLVLALLSYTILSNVNPQLVNIRLPQTWMIKQSQINPEYCFELPTSTTGIAKFVADNINSTKDQRIAAASKITDWTVPPKNAECGFEYLTEPGRDKSCQGSSCDPGKVCVKEEESQPSKCTKGVLAGKIEMKGIFNPDQIIEDDMLLIALCEDGSTVEAFDINSQQGSDGNEFYVFTEKPRSNICAGHSGLVGFYIAAEINDQRTGEPAYDDFHAIGRQKAGSSQCSVNLSMKVWKKASPNLKCLNGSDNWRCGCEGFADFIDDHLSKLKALMPELKKDNLFSLEELEKGSLTCDILITRTEFPMMDDNTTSSDCTELN
jgi:hypothetical protein